MLDKSLTHCHIYMALPGREVAERTPRLPEGYGWRLYRPGDEAHWARIETSVLEFSDEAEALDYFTRIFLPHREQLAERLVFVTDPGGTPVATALAWYSQEADGRRAVLHWVAARPDQQGKGLGRAVVQLALNRFARLEPGLDVRLHTQTWSYPAVLLYRKLGFRALRNGGVAMPARESGLPQTRPNQFDQALEVLRPVLTDAQWRDLRDSAI